LEFIDFIVENYWASKSVFEYVMINTGPNALGKFYANYYGDYDNYILNLCEVQPYIGECDHDKLTHVCHNNDKILCAKIWRDTSHWGMPPKKQGNQSALFYVSVVIGIIVVIVVIVALILALYYSNNRKCDNTGKIK
jgi:hypothetical protein